VRSTRCFRGPKMLNYSVMCAAHTFQPKNHVSFFENLGVSDISWARELCPRPLCDRYATAVECTSGRECHCKASTDVEELSIDSRRGRTQLTSRRPERHRGSSINSSNSSRATSARMRRRRSGRGLEYQCSFSLYRRGGSDAARCCVGLQRAEHL